MGEREREIETFRRLITEVHPQGFVSIVSDTWDYWQVLTEYTRELQAIIMQRQGRVVFRPDSGDPVAILCGTAADDDTRSERSARRKAPWRFCGKSLAALSTKKDTRCWIRMSA
jgi:nicotinamide phosphoribosyltransferase